VGLGVEPVTTTTKNEVCFTFSCSISSTNRGENPKSLTGGIKSGTGLPTGNVFESTLEWTYGEVIVNSGIGSHTPCFSLDSAPDVCLEQESLHYCTSNLFTVFTLFLKVFFIQSFGFSQLSNIFLPNISFSLRS
jgi:hypothetical protein